VETGGGGCAHEGVLMRSGKRSRLQRLRSGRLPRISTVSATYKQYGVSARLVLVAPDMVRAARLTNA